ncbi:MAG: hypothetical protein HKN91_14460 [Acidimicrobiia bacterium]|nr:hypothetical protein [Acidimicrobiia bacterium]
MGDLAMIIKTKAQPGKRDELFELYNQILIPRAEENDSQEVVVWSADQHDPDTFYLFEIYSDGEAMGANAAAPWFAEYMAHAGPLLADEPEVGMATPRWSKGI